MNNGQACVAQTRILASRARYDEVVDAVATMVGGLEVGDPSSATTEIGPLVAKRQQERVEKYIALGQEEGARITVGDTGQGIAPEVLPHVFERFRQADPNGRAGLGLGLAIVRHLIELHGGVVGAASQGEGLGATFTFTLPGAAGERELAIPHSAAAESAPGDGKDDGARDLTGIRVLVVEDEVDTRDALTVMLSEAGASVTAVGTAGEALARLVDAKPDVLVCDIGLPYEDGYSLIRTVRTHENGGPSIPAVALTAYAQESDRQRALAAGYQFHLAKPVQPAKLLRLLAETAARMPADGAGPVTHATAGTAGGTPG